MLRSLSVALSLAAVVHTAAFAQNPGVDPPAVTLFENVRVFDGTNGVLSASMNVLVRGNTIEKISKDPIPVDRSASTKLIDGGGRTLMPGLIDAHWHAMLIRPTPADSIHGDVGYNNIAAADEATDTVMRGFTTVRDVAIIFTILMWNYFSTFVY